MHAHRTDTIPSGPASRTDTPPLPRAGTVAPPSRRRQRAAAVGGGAIAALAVWAVAVPVLGVDLHAAPGTNPAQPVGPGHVVVTGLLAGLAGWGSLALLERTVSRARTVWTVIAAVVLAVSLSGPLAGVTAADTVVLAVMHLAVGAVLIPGLARTAASGAAGR